MECPSCGNIESGVIDSRPTKERTAIRRRRQCLACGGRFTTFESTEERLLFLLMKRHAGQGASKKNFETALTFTSRAFKGLSEEIEKLIDKPVKHEIPKVAKEPKRKVAAKAKRRKKAIVRKPRARKVIKVTATAQVLKIIKRHKKGVDINKIKDKTGFDDAKIRSIVYRAYKEGKINRIGRGVYVST